MPTTIIVDEDALRRLSKEFFARKNGTVRDSKDRPTA